MRRRRTETRGTRRGITLLNAIVVGVILLLIAFFTLPMIETSHGPSRQNWCRSNMRNIALAMVGYEGRQGHFPGYMNMLERQDKRPYVDPATIRPVPVSWVVELLPDLDRGALYEQWRMPLGNDTGPSPSAPSGTAGSAAPYVANVDIYMEILTCPSHDADRRGTPLSYVVNTGMRDLPRALAATGELPAMPRDWPANGIFFDNYSEHPLIAGKDRPLGPMVKMRSEMIRDAKDKTLLITENVDAKSYSFHAKDFPEGDPALSEIAWGFTWAAGDVDAKSGKPTMSVPAGALAPNAEHDTPHRELDYRYARPSSKHPGGFNVAFAGSNVIFLRDTISYSIYAKLMASDDAGMKLPGSQELLDSRLRDYKLEDSDLNP